MKPLQAGMKVTKILGKPFELFFGSDEKSFMTLLGATVLLYFSGFPDAATITAVYSTVFAFSGMQNYSSSSDSSDETSFDEDKMMDIIGQAGEALDEIQDEKDDEEEN